MRGWARRIVRMYVSKLLHIFICPLLHRPGFSIYSIFLVLNFLFFFLRFSLTSFYFCWNSFVLLNRMKFSFRKLKDYNTYVIIRRHIFNEMENIVKNFNLSSDFFWGIQTEVENKLKFEL